MDLSRQNGVEGSFDLPAEYRIHVQGPDLSSWSDCLGGMNLRLLSGSGKECVTVLEGCVKDQAELSGLLNTIYDLNATVLLVERLREESEAPGDG